MADVFISYSRKDFDIAAALRDELCNSGLTVFFDRDIEISAAWQTAIENQLGVAKCVVAIWSPNSVESLWVRSEARYGLNRNVLVSVTLRGTKPPLLFSEYQCIDFGDPTELATHPNLAVLLSAIQSKIARSHGADTQSYFNSSIVLADNIESTGEKLVILSVPAFQSYKSVVYALGSTQFPITIGRGSGCTIVIADPQISRVHCRISAPPEGFFLDDLDSKNGLFVNYERVTSSRLWSGDLIKLSTLVTLHFQVVRDKTALHDQAPPSEA